MPSYFIIGASRGICLSFLDNLSSSSDNTVIGLVGNVADTEAKFAPWNRSHIHLVQGDLTNYETIMSAVDATAKISGMANVELVRKYNIHEDGPYSIGKATVNMVVAKFSAGYAKDRVLFLGV